MAIMALYHAGCLKPCESHQERAADASLFRPPPAKGRHRQPTQYRQPTARASRGSLQTEHRQATDRAQAGRRQATGRAQARPHVLLSHRCQLGGVKSVSVSMLTGCCNSALRRVQEAVGMCRSNSVLVEGRVQNPPQEVSVPQISANSDIYQGDSSNMLTNRPTGPTGPPGLTLTRC